MMARVKLESHVSHAVRARWAVPVGASGRDALVRHLVYAFLRSDPEGATDWIDSTVPTDPDELRTMLDFLLTARPPAPLPEDRRGGARPGGRQGPDRRRAGGVWG